MRVANGIPPGCPLFLPVGTVNSVATLKPTSAVAATLTLALTLTMDSAQTLKAGSEKVIHVVIRNQGGKLDVGVLFELTG